MHRSDRFFGEVGDRLDRDRDREDEDREAKVRRGRQIRALIGFHVAAGGQANLQLMKELLDEFESGNHGTKSEIEAYRAELTRLTLLARGGDASATSN